MKFGLIVTNQGWLTEHIGLLDQTHFASLYVVDHPEFPIPNPWTYLAFVAARTERIRLGTHVTGIPFHHPHELAKQVATVDVLSGGRTSVGVGTGYERQDFAPHGYTMLPFKGRVEQLEESISIMKSLWTQETTKFAGKHYTLEGPAHFEPKPVQQPHPPVLVGLNTSGLALKAAARVGDGINTWQLGPTQAAALGDEFRQLAAAAGRDASDLLLTSDVVFARNKTADEATEYAHSIRDRVRGWGRAEAVTNWDASGVLHGDADNMAEHAARFAAIGVEELTVSISNVEDMLWFSEHVIARLLARA
jgi:alkanesulfonate monooxygenase SsuD/methylene tetrahydromethanopterin reductase-like flavin-dependent oxidoreductase (luciferase family)